MWNEVLVDLQKLRKIYTLEFLNLHIYCVWMWIWRLLMMKNSIILHNVSEIDWTKDTNFLFKIYQKIHIESPEFLFVKCFFYFNIKFDIEISKTFCYKWLKTMLKWLMYLNKSYSKF